MPGVCYSQNVMLCLQCRRWQPKAAWSPAQWKRLQCVALDLQRNCCSECSPNWWKPTTTRTSPTSSDSGRHPEPVWAQNLLAVLGVASTGELVQRIYRVATLWRRVNQERPLSEFIIHWMQVWGKSYRKRLSHSGALRYRQGMDGLLNDVEGHWMDPVSRQRYFDPGNDIYSRAFQLAFPEICGEENWNVKTQGDIFEAILALKCLDDYGAVRHLPGYPHFPDNCPAARVAAWVEELATLVWGVCLIYPVTDSPAEWASRWHVQDATTYESVD